MARRKKEPPDTHRANIAAAGGRLFAKRGADVVTVDESSGKPGIARLDLCVFPDREEIVRFLVLESMEGAMRLHLRRAGGGGGRLGELCEYLPGAGGVPGAVSLLF